MILIVRLFLYLSTDRCCTQQRAAGLLLGARLAGDISRLQHGGQQRREQCHVYSRRTRLTTTCLSSVQNIGVVFTLLISRLHSVARVKKKGTFSRRITPPSVSLNNTIRSVNSYQYNITPQSAVYNAQAVNRLLR